MAARSTSHELRLCAAWTAAAWLLVLAIVYLSVTPRPPEIPLAEGDKYGHLLAYGSTMLWFAQLYDGRRRWLAAVGLVALGVALEYVQRWTGYRSFDVWDMAADAAGVAAGLAAAPPRLPNVLAGLERLLRVPPRAAP